MPQYAAMLWLRFLPTPEIVADLDGLAFELKCLHLLPISMQAVLHVRWKMILPKLAVAAGDNCFVPIGASLKGLTGKYNKRFVGGASYYGSWQDGMPHGKGKYVSEDGTEYEGEWSWSKMHGTGTFTYSNGDVYTGAWRDNFRHGIGTCVARNGDVYAGEWRFGYQHGRGRHETQDGVVYDGEWKENRAHGCGLVTEPDGDKWDGMDSGPPVSSLLFVAGLY